jgi:MFS superfamily sulfate permease-like transporter
MTISEIEAKIQKLPKRQRELVRAWARHYYDANVLELAEREQELHERAGKTTEQERASDEKKRKIEDAEKKSAKQMKLGEAVEALMVEFAGSQMRAYMSERRMGW